jgi:hypothetical protein
MSVGNKEQRWVNATVASLGSYEGIDEALETLNKAKALELAGDLKDLHLEVEEDYGSHRIILVGKRPETDQEQAKRLEGEAERERYRRQMYENLKKEFGT